MSVARNEAESRYELTVDGELVGIADYRVRGSTAVFPHTEIQASRRGAGLGAVLVQGALDDARAQGWSVMPACWYVASFIDRHPAYADLTAPR